MITKGIAMWAFTKNPDTKFDPQWRITLQLDDEEVKKLKAAGLKPKRNDDDVYEYKFYRKVDRKSGGKNPAPRVVDANKNPFDELIGNGSLVNVQFVPFSWEFKGKKGMSADLVAVQVLNLVPYVGDLSTEDEFTSVGSEESDSTEEDF